ncbi:hypothetical protein LA080_011839 [Diaporthe eres]|nr:hypothetical protein LA080_011839 [Diaporthe eres]
MLDASRSRNPSRESCSSQTTALMGASDAAASPPRPFPASPTIHGSETSFASNTVEEQPATPSSTISSLPLSRRSQLTPAAEKLRQHIDLLARGEGPDPVPWAQYPLAWADWESFQAFLAAVQDSTGDDIDERVCCFYQDKLRLDYFCDTQSAVLRMPGRQHELFLSKLIDEIKSAVRSYTTVANKRRSPGWREAAAYAQLIEHTASARIFYTVETETGASRRAHHDPDGSFSFLPPAAEAEAPIPGLVVEVSHTQKRKDLAKLADHYLLCTGGPHVQLVLAFDLDYRDGYRACVIAFRRQSEMHGDEEVVSVVQDEPKVFRDEDGALLPGKLRFLLSDCGQPGLSLPDHKQQVVVDFSKLHEALLFAEGQTQSGPPTRGKTRRQQLQERLQPGLLEQLGQPAKAWSPNVRKRLRESSSPEQIAEADERRIQREELHVEKRVRREDATYTDRTAVRREEG